MNQTSQRKLSIEDWTARAKKHSQLVSPYTNAFLKRRSVGQTHAVHDFLFTYYSCSPLKLSQWIPSFEEQLEITPEIREEYPWFKEHWFHEDDNCLSLNSERLHDNMRSLTKFVADLCSNIMQRAPRFGCYGLHEWAMVYKLSPEELRHKRHKLRLSPEELARFVESQAICCSHYDAYRFFTKEAHPLNVLNPVIETRLEMEQAGCLHANMDLYKWSTKLWPWIGSDFLAKTFLLALEGRELDMRASPYDLLDEGYSPICIETEQGRRQYQKEQQEYAERSQVLRKELLDFCQRLLAIKKVDSCQKSVDSSASRLFFL